MRGQSLNQELLDHIRLEIHGAVLFSALLFPSHDFVLFSSLLPLDFVWPLIEPYH